LQKIAASLELSLAVSLCEYKLTNNILNYPFTSLSKTNMLIRVWFL
jgi:hypothetical protein